MRIPAINGLPEEFRGMDDKERALRESGTLHRGAGDVEDELFRGHAFFDPRDLVQVKYEMIRRVEQEGWTAARAARVFGLSRTAFYQARAVLAEQGLVGLVPGKPGPKGGHKLTDEVLEFVEVVRLREPSLRVGELCERVADRFRLSVHPRSLERALERRKRGRH